jgi:hypothetical protein
LIGRFPDLARLRAVGHSSSPVLGKSAGWAKTSTARAIRRHSGPKKIGVIAHPFKWNEETRLAYLFFFVAFFFAVFLPFFLAAMSLTSFPG